MISRTLLLAFFVLACAMSRVAAKEREVFKPVDLTSSQSRAQVLSPQYLQELGSHEASLKAIEIRLSGIDDRLKSIQGSLDHDILPTIHVMDFIKWFFALVLAVIVGEEIRGLYSRRKAAQPSGA